MTLLPFFLIAIFAVAFVPVASTTYSEESNAADVLKQIFELANNAESAQLGAVTLGSGDALPLQESSVTLEISAFNDDNNNSRNDVNEDPFENLLVVVWMPTTDEIKELVTDANGIAKLDLVTDEFYAIVLQPEDKFVSTHSFTLAGNIRWGILHISDTTDDSIYKMNIGITSDRPTAPTDSIKIGALLPLSGSNANLGEENKAATEFGIKKFNERIMQTGLDISLELVVEDNESNQKISMEKIKKLHDDGIDIVIGPLGSSNTTAVKEFADDNDMLVLSCCSTAPSLSMEGDSIFRLLPDDTNQGPAITRLALEEGIDVLVTIYIDDPWGRGLKDTVMKSFTDAGKTFAAPISYDPKEDGPDGYSQVTERLAQAVQDNDTDNVGVLAIGFSEVAEIMKAAASHDMLDDITWLGADGIANDATLINDPKALEFAQSVNFVAVSPSTITSPITEEVLDYVTETVGHSPNPYVYSSYDAAWLVGNSIVKAADASASEVKKVITEVADSYIGARGNIKLNDNGDLVSTGYDLFAIREDGWEKTGSYTASTDEITGLLPSTIKVGALYSPLAWSDVADQNLEGAKLGVEDFNAYLDEKNAHWDMELVARDVRPNETFDSNYIQTVIEQLHTQEGIQTVIGPMTSNNVKEIQSYVDKNDILVVSPSSTAVGLSIPNDNIYRITPDDFNQSKVISNLLYENQIASIVIIYRDDIWGAGLFNGISSEFATLGGHTHPAPISYQPRYADPASPDNLRPHVNLLRVAVSDALSVTSGNVAVVAIGFDEIVNMMNIAYELKDSQLGSVQWFGTDGIYGVEQLRDGPPSNSAKFASKVKFTAVQTTITIEPDSEADKIKERLKTKLDITDDDHLSAYAYSSYEAAWLIGLAIENAGNAEGEAILNSFNDAVATRNTLGNTFGTIQLNSNGDLAVSDYAISQFQNDDWQRIGTFDANTQKINFLQGVQYKFEPSNTDTDVEPTDKVGLLLPLSGDNETLGEENKAATEFGIEKFNERMMQTGLDISLELVVEDNESDKDVSMEKIKKLHDDGIDIVIGPLGSSNTTAVKKFADDNDMLVLSCCSTAPSLSLEGDSIFRLLPDDTNQGPAITRLALEEGIDVLVTIYIDDPWGSGLKDTVMKSFTDAGKTFAAPISYDPKEDGPDGYSQVTERLAQAVQDNDTDNVGVLAIGFSEVAEIMKAAASHDILDDVLWLGADGIANDAAIINDPQVLEFARSVNFIAVSPSTPTSPITDMVLDHVTEKVKRSPNPYVYSSYDAAWLIGNSLLKVEEKSASEVKKVITEVADSYIGARGNIQLNDNGDLVSTGYDLFAVRGDSWLMSGAYDANTDEIVGLLSSTVKVGAMFPQGIRDTAAQNLEGAKLGVADFNDYIGKKNAHWKMVLVDKDTRPSTSFGPARSLELIKELHTQEGIQAVVGPQFSSNTNAIKPYVDKNDILVVSPSSTAVGLSTPNDNIYRITPDDFNQSKAIAQLLIENDITTIVTIYRDDIWGQGLHDGISSEFEALGGYTHDIDIPFSPQFENFDAVIDTLNQGVLEALSSTSGNVAVMFIGLNEITKAMDVAFNLPDSQLGNVRWFGTDGNHVSPSLVDKENPDIVKFASQVGFTAVQVTFADSQLSNKIKEHIQDELNITNDPNAYAYSSYEAAWLIGLAIENAGNAEGEAILDSFDDAVDARNKMPNIFKRITLNQNGDLSGVDYAISQIQDGEWKRISTYVDSEQSIRPFLN